MVSEVSPVEDVPSSTQDEVQKFNSSVAEIGTDFTYKHKIIWRNLIGYIVYHILFLMGAYHFFALNVHPLTMIHSVFILVICGFAVTIGAHRYYTHRAFKANTTLRLIFVVLFAMSGQNTMWAWVRNHRQHHKYSDTDADPHNARRGFFFSHIGWFLCYKNPKVIYYGKRMDMRDLDADPFIKFHTMFFIEMYILLAIVIPCGMQIYLWNEDPLKSFLVCYCGRTCLALNLMCLVNSYAHTHGTKPYDKNILPGENRILSMLTTGEGWHNYHHAFPWDYRTSELGMPNNWSTAVINYFIKKGWVYDVKTASEESIKKRILRTGDKSHEKYEDLASTNTISL